MCKPQLLLTARKQNFITKVLGSISKKCHVKFDKSLKLISSIFYSVRRHRTRVYFYRLEYSLLSVVATHVLLIIRGIPCWLMSNFF